MTKAAAVMVCGGEKKLFLRFLNFDVWRGGRLSGRPFCSRPILRGPFLSEQSYLAKEFCLNPVYYKYIQILSLLLSDKEVAKSQT